MRGRRHRRDTDASEGKRPRLPLPVPEPEPEVGGDGSREPGVRFRWFQNVIRIFFKKRYLLRSLFIKYTGKYQMHRISKWLLKATVLTVSSKDGKRGFI